MFDGEPSGRRRSNGSKGPSRQSGASSHSATCRAERAPFVRPRDCRWEENDTIRSSAILSATQAFQSLGRQILQLSRGAHGVPPRFAFIAYFNRTLAKPFKWTMSGKPLAA